LIKQWIDNLAEVDPDTNLPLCPFAKPAWEAGRVQVVEADMLWPEVLASAAELDDDLDVIVVVDDSYTGSYNHLEEVANALNDFFSDAGMDCWVLSHLSDEAVIFVQRLTDLDNSAAKLEKLGYYESYDHCDYHRLVVERRQRRYNHARYQEDDAR
jgi:hypothetical protein